MGAPRPWKEGRSCETPYVYNDLGVNEIRLAQVVVPQCQIWGDDDAIEGKQPLASSASETQLFPYRRQSNASPNGIDGLRPCWQTNHCSMHPSPKVNVPPNTIHLGVVVFGVLSVVEMTQSRDSVLQSSQPAVLYSERGEALCIPTDSPRVKRMSLATGTNIELSRSGRAHRRPPALTKMHCESPNEFVRIFHRCDYKRPASPLSLSKTQPCTCIRA